MSSLANKENFLSSCQVICLQYLYVLIKNDEEIDNDDATKIEGLIDIRIKDAPTEIVGFMKTAAESLAKLSCHFEIITTKKFQDAVNPIRHRDLTPENFQDAANVLLKPSHVENWEQVASLLYLSYKIIKSRGINDVELVVDLCADYMERFAKDFVKTQGGWQTLSSVETSDPEGILSSIVMVQHREEELPFEPKEIPPTDSPPFSIVTPPCEDEEERESLNSATPPEIVDRPPMTASLMQMMGAGDSASVANSNENTGASSEGTEFEMLSSINNSAPETGPSSPKQHDEACDKRTGETSAFSKQSLVKQLETFVASEQNPVPDAEESLEEEGGKLTDYLPQISLGVAAAAACIGIFMLKKAS